MMIFCVYKLIEIGNEKSYRGHQVLIISVLIKIIKTPRLFICQSGESPL